MIGLMSPQRQAAYRLYPIMLWADSYIYDFFCHFVKSFNCCSDVWKGDNDDLFDQYLSGDFTVRRVSCYIYAVASLSGWKAILFVLS